MGTTEVDFTRVEINWLKGRDHLFDVFVTIGILIIVLHPTFASLFGSSGSRVVGVFALIFLCPAARRIRLVPLFGFAVAAAALIVLSRETTPLFSAMAAYAFYDILLRRPRYTANVIYGVLALATFVAFLQTWMPPYSFVNFHATAVSDGGWLNQIRPTSIFPSQVYFSQFQLLCVAVIVIVRETRWPILVMFGLSCVLAGSTGGLIAVALVGLLMAQRGWYALLTYCLVMAFFLVAMPQRFDFTSPLDLMDSVVTTRIAADDIYVPTVSSAGAPNLGLILIKLLAIGGAMIGAALTVPRLSKTNASKLGKVALVLSSVAIGQAILPAIESLYFSLSLGVIMYAFLMLQRIQATPRGSTDEVQAGSNERQA